MSPDLELTAFRFFSSYVQNSPGAARVLVTFSCAAKEKVTKEKAAQFAAPAFCEGGPALLDKPGGLRNSRTVLTIA